MTQLQMNSIVGITDYDEGTNLSCHLLQHGWSADHARSADEVLSDIEEGGYGLVVIDEEIIEESNWSLPEYLEAIGPDTRMIVLTEPGSHLQEDYPQPTCRFLQHPYTFESLRLTIEAETMREQGSIDELYAEFSDVLGGGVDEVNSDSLDLEDLF